ncbi:MAG: hypothetical protein KatS3mg096_247 [Candidatus Parcubacteria bacterium]|nr:MAG: hypothetical protein KatS3mg096_247 [Candidatus Parcubacteria bacterium]
MYQVQNTLDFRLIKQSKGFFKTVIVCYLDNKNQQNNFEPPENVEEIKWLTKEELV